MTLLLFLTGGTTIASSGAPPPTFTGEFAVSGGKTSMQFQTTELSYTVAPLSAQTE